MVAILRLSARLAIRLSDITPAKMRQGYLQLTTIYHLDDVAMAEVIDFNIRPGLKVRLYRPGGIAKPAPALVYFHGGGGVIGDLESHDTLCRYIARKAEMVVLAVDYRLGPEHLAPAQAEDVIAAFKWVRENAGELGLIPGRIGVGGDSAGGQLSFVLATQSITPTLPQPPPDMPTFLWTIYPMVDQRRVTPSMKEFTEDLLLTAPVMAWFDANVRGEDMEKSDPLISPAALDTRDLPPTFILTVGYDPLRDEGMTMAERLETEGVAVIHHHHPRLLHEFISMGGVVPEARAALDQAIDALVTIVVPSLSKP